MQKEIDKFKPGTYRSGIKCDCHKNARTFRWVADTSHGLDELWFQLRLSTVFRACSSTSGHLLLPLVCPRVAGAGICNPHPLLSGVS